MLVIYIAKAADWENQRRKEVSMKKSTVFVLFLLAAMLLGITMAASAEDKGTHWANINVALNNLEAAISRNQNVSSALGEVRSAVYAGIKYLVSIQANDPRAMEIIRYADEAVSNKKDAKYLLIQAHYFNNAIFGTEVTGNYQPPSKHS